MITTSSRVRAKDFREPWFIERAKELAEPLKLHRKLWEFCVTTQIYQEQRDARHGQRVLGFGVGLEGLASWFALDHAWVTATDRPDSSPLWAEGQHASHKVDLWKSGICSWDRFNRQVTFQPVDMNVIPEELLQGQFDLTWSAGSFEHLGSITQGLSFFCKQMACLKPNGLAVHSTELNPAEGPTLEHEDIVLFQAAHLAQLQERLAQQGDTLWPLDLTPGEEDADLHVDVEPWSVPHLSMKIGAFTTTSVMLVAQRGAA